jgi:hypothetical protein
MPRKPSVASDRFHLHRVRYREAVDLDAVVYLDFRSMRWGCSRRCCDHLARRGLVLENYYHEGLDGLAMVLRLPPRRNLLLLRLYRQLRQDEGRAPSELVTLVGRS